VIVAGRERVAPSADPDLARERARSLLAEGLSRKDAAGQLARELGIPRNDAYRMVAGTSGDPRLKPGV